jgi:hypothetical protein
VIPFVAGVLADLVVGPRHEDRCCPRPRPRLRVVDRELVAQRAWTDSRSPSGAYARWRPSSTG